MKILVAKINVMDVDISDADAIQIYPDIKDGDYIMLQYQDAKDLRDLLSTWLEEHVDK